MPENIVVGREARRRRRLPLASTPAVPAEARAPATGPRRAVATVPPGAPRGSSGAVLDLSDPPRPRRRARGARPPRRRRRRLDEVLDLDERRRAATPAGREPARRAERGRRRRSPRPSAPARTPARRSRAMRDDRPRRSRRCAERARRPRSGCRRALATLPNLPDPTAARRGHGPPRGRRAAGRDRPRPPRARRRHASTWSAARGCRGSRFAYLRGDARHARVRARALGAREARSGHGFEPVIPPVLVREQALYGTGFLPDTEQQIYRLPDDDLYLVGTSEVALASLHAGEILEPPSCRCATPASRRCFRREAGAAGKDTRGIFRVHQFDKVEMFCVRRAGGLRRRARAPAGDRGGDPQRARRSPTAS